MDAAQAMRLAVTSAERVRGTTSPNPPVGAVVLDAHGELVGTGATQPPGGPHAEVVALDQAAERARGGTVVVTLEPCDHTGRTGPCTRALSEAGIARVVYAQADPARGGAHTLRQSGIETVHTGEQVDGLTPWLTAQQLHRPYVTWKLAASLDGRVAAADLTSRWITGPEAREDVHRLRAQVDAIVVGVGTVLADDPELTTRPDPGHQPVRVVLDRRGRTPNNAKVHPALVLDQSPEQALQTLHGQGVVHALLEGGPTLAGAFLEADLVDHVVAYVAPLLLGRGPAAVRVPGWGTLTDAARLRLTDIRQIGQDVRLDLRRA